MLMGQMVTLRGRGLLVDLTVFEISNFDMILRMDFLGKYRVETNCRKKKVKFNLDSGDEFTFEEG